MNAEASTKPDSITPIATPEQLVAAREARGLSMSDVAAKLGMMPRQIAAIEEGRWEALPGQAFIRGAIRAYGKALQVDVAPLLATLGAQSTPELRPSSSLDSPLPRYGALGFDHGGSGSRIVWILLGVIGVIAIAMYFGRGADLRQVLDPGTQPDRTVEVVPLTPNASQESGDTGAARGDSGGPTAPAAPGIGGNAASGSLGGPGASSGIAAGGALGDSSASTATGTTDAPAAGSDIASPATTDTTATTGSTASASGSDSDAPDASTPAPGASSSPAPAASSMPAAASSPSGEDAVHRDSPSAAASASTPFDAAGETAGAARSADVAEPSAAEGGSLASAPEGTNASASPATESAVATQPDSLVMHFERESWVEVRDATGRLLLLGTQPANSTREVSGEKPYSMTIGNAPFVRVEHGGHNVDLGRVTQKGVARLRVE